MATEEEGNLFTRKLGPLPGYVWIALGVAGFVVYSARKKSSSSSSTSSTTASGTTGAVSYSPQQPYSYSQSNSDSALASLVSALAAQVQAGGGSVSPGNGSGPATSPGSTGNPGVQPTPVTTPADTSLPSINSADFPVVGSNNVGYLPIGQISGPGGDYAGENIGGGAPTYAFVGGSWQQDFNAATLPVGTQIGTLPQFQSYVIPGTVHEKLG